MKISILYPFILILALTVMHNNTIAQSLVLLNPTSPTVTITADPNEEIVKYVHKIQNSGLWDIDVKTQVKVNQIAEGHKYSFCDLNQCYPYTNTDFAPELPFKLKGYESTDEFFYVELNTGEKLGITQLHFTFINDGNHDDKVEYTLTVDVTTSVKDDLIRQTAINSYPNPASDIVKFNIELPEDALQSQLIISDLLGNTVLNLGINPGKNSIYLNTSTMNEGVYFYTVKAGGFLLKTEKLIISR